MISTNKLREKQSFPGQNTQPLCYQGLRGWAGVPASANLRARAWELPMPSALK